jgi:hypothetical protein
VQAHDIEAQDVIAPSRVMLQEKGGGPDDLALLGSRHRGERTAKIAPAALPDFYDRKDSGVETHQVQFADPAAEIARDDLQSLHAQMVCRQLFGCEASHPTQILSPGYGRHAAQTALFAQLRHRDPAL